MSELALRIKKDLLARGKTEQCAVHWKTWTERFESVCGTKVEYARDDVINYLAWCREQGFSQLSIETMLRPIRLVAQIQGWTFPKLSMKKARDSEIYRPMLSKDEIVRAILEGQRVLIGEELALLALSTTYGLRRAEMAFPNGPVIDVEAGTVRINTAKGGEVTTHLIPDEIKSYLSEYVPFSCGYTSAQYRNIMDRVGVKYGRRYSWHTIRRTLITELLLSEISSVTVHRFMRWSDGSIKGNFGVMMMYAKKDQARIDSEIFKVHPFLRYWSKDYKHEREQECWHCRRVYEANSVESWCPYCGEWNTPRVDLKAWDLRMREKCERKFCSRDER